MTKSEITQSLISKGVEKEFIEKELPETLENNVDYVTRISKEWEISNEIEEWADEKERTP